MSGQQKKTQALFFSLAVVGALLGLFMMSSSSSKKQTTVQNAVVPPPAQTRAVIMPLDDQPMREYTPYFQKFQIDVTTQSYIRTYTYHWYEPTAQDGKVPLVVVLHGSTGKSYAAEHLITPSLSERHPAYIFVPVIAETNAWADVPQDNDNLPNELSDGFALPDMVRIIKNLQQLYPIDPTRIYVTGCSMGGIGSFAAARYYPDVFAAAIPISGAWNPVDGANMTNIPMWVLHGKLDDAVPIESAADTARMIKSYGGDIHYTAFSNMGHQCPSPRLYNEKIWHWLFSQRKT